jgi:hypothetical protein
LGEGEEGEFLERRSAKQSEGARQRFRCRRGVASGEVSAALGRERLEAVRIELAGGGPQRVAVRRRDEPRPTAVVAQRLPQPGDVGLE